MNWVDESFLQTLGIKPVAGRLFSKEFPADTNCQDDIEPGSDKTDRL